MTVASKGFLVIAEKVVANLFFVYLLCLVYNVGVEKLKGDFREKRKPQETTFHYLDRPCLSGLEPFGAGHQPGHLAVQPGPGGSGLGYRCGP